MSMIDPKGAKPEPEAMALIRRHCERYKHYAKNPIVTAGVDEAMFDAEESVDFWRTMPGKSHSAHGFSPPPNFYNESGGTIADSIAQILP